MKSVAQSFSLWRSTECPHVNVLKDTWTSAGKWFEGIISDQSTSRIRTWRERKQSDNDTRSHESEALMRLRQVFMWRHINSDSSRLLFGHSCDGGTKLWPVVHWLRHYLLGHFCRRQCDALSPDTGLLWQAVAPQLKCSEDLVCTHHQFLLLVFLEDLTLPECVCVPVSCSLSYWELRENISDWGGEWHN